MCMLTRAMRSLCMLTRCMLTRTACTAPARAAAVGNRPLEPTAEEDDEGDVEVTQEDHDTNTEALSDVPAMRDSRGLSRANPDGASNSLSIAPYTALLDGSLPGDTSLLQSLSNHPQDDRGPGPSGVLRQAYDLIDSMGPVADHTVVPADHLDTGVMISVPQVRLLVREALCLPCRAPLWLTPPAASSLYGDAGCGARRTASLCIVSAVLVRDAGCGARRKPRLSLTSAPPLCSSRQTGAPTRQRRTWSLWRLRTPPTARRQWRRTSRRSRRPRALLTTSPHPKAATACRAAKRRPGGSRCRRAWKRWAPTRSRARCS